MPAPTRSAAAGSNRRNDAGDTVIDLRENVTSRTPPSNLQAEASLLGAMLLSRDAIADAIEIVDAEHFYKPGHMHVYEAILSLYSAGEPADPVTVGEELNRAGLLDAIGGLDPVNPVQTVYAYDVARETWSEVAPLPEAIHAMAATVFKGEIWVLGGRLRSQEIIRRVWIYNAARNAWRPGPPMPKPMDLLGVVAVSNRIHAVLESKYFVYDAGTRTWRRGPSLKVPRHALALYAVRGKLYAIGGCIVPQLEDSPAVETLRLSG